MLIEFQTTATNYLFLFREQLRQIPVSLTDEITDEHGRPMVVNRLLVDNATHLRQRDETTRPVPTGAPGLPRDVAARRIQVVQPVIMEVVYLDDLVRAGDTPAPVRRLSLGMILDVTLSATDGDAILTLTYHGATGDLPPDMLAAVDARLRAAVKPDPRPLDLEGVLEGLPVVNAGISCKPPGALGEPGNVALRIEVGELASGETEWRRFLDGTYDDLLGASGQRSFDLSPTERWAAFLDRGLLERHVRRLLEESLAAGTELQLRSDIDIRWGNLDEVPHLDARFKAVAVDACDLGALGTHDLRLDVRISIRLSVPADNVLRLDLKVDAREDDLDVRACSADLAILWPLVAPPRGAAGRPQWDAFMWPGILGPVRRLAVATHAADETSLEPPTPSLIQLSADECRRDQALTADGSPGFGSLELVDCRGVAAGLVLTGRQVAQPETRAALIEASHTDFVLRPPEIPCARVAESGASVTGQVQAAADCVVVNVGDPVGDAGAPRVPIQKWQHRFLDEGLARTLGLRTVEDFYADGIVVTLGCAMPGSRYYDDPRPVRLLLKTNGGARVFTYGVIARLGDQAVSDLVRAGVARALTDCKPMIDPWWGRLHRFSPPWQVVPSPPSLRASRDRRLWTISFVGLAPLDGMAAVVGGTTVQSTRANRHGRAVLSVLEPATAPAELSLTYAPGPEAAGRQGRGRMMISQVALAEVGRCRLAGRVRSLQVVRQQGTRRLYAMHDDGFSLIDVSVPARPRLRSVRRAEHLRGAVVDADGVLLLSGERPQRVDPLRPPPAAGAGEPEESPVVRTLAAGGRFYAVRRRSVDVFDRQLRRLGSRPLDQAVHDAVLVGDRLILGGPDGLLTVDPGRSWRRSSAERLDVGAVEALAVAELAAPPGSVLVRRGGRVALVELPEREAGSRQPMVLAEYEEPPWFERCVSFESYLAFVVGDEISINAVVGRAARCHLSG